MSSNLMRLGLLAGLATLLAGAIAWAQGFEGNKSTGEGGIAVFNPVEGRAVVITSRPEGARVEKGDIVCELDATELRDRLATQELVVRGAEADVHGARIAREVAVMAVIEYKEGTFLQELRAAEGGIKLAEAKLARAEDHLDWSRRMFEKGYASVHEKSSDELALMQARLALEQAHSKKKALVDHSMARTIKALTGQVETARARELDKQAAAERARSTQKRLMDQIGRCKVAAPVAGRIEYATPIGVGAVVRDGQVFFRVVP